MDLGKIKSLMGQAKGNIEMATCDSVTFRRKDGVMEHIKKPVVVRIKMGNEITYTVTPGNDGVEEVLSSGSD